MTYASNTTNTGWDLNRDPTFYFDPDLYSVLEFLEASKEENILLSIEEITTLAEYPQLYWDTFVYHYDIMGWKWIYTLQDVEDPFWYLVQKTQWSDDAIVSSLLEETQTILQFFAQEMIQSSSEDMYPVLWMILYSILYQTYRTHVVVYQDDSKECFWTATQHSEIGLYRNQAMMEYFVEQIVPNITYDMFGYEEDDRAYILQEWGQYLATLIFPNLYRNLAAPQEDTVSEYRRVFNYQKWIFQFLNEEFPKYRPHFTQDILDEMRDLYEALLQELIILTLYEHVECIRNDSMTLENQKRELWMLGTIIRRCCRIFRSY